MKRLVRVFTWSPCGKQPWHFHLWNCLLVWATVIVLFLSLPSWLGHSVSFPSQVPDNSHADVDLFDYDQPLALGDGRCMVIDTRETVEC